MPEHLDIVNLQKTVKIDISEVRKFCKRLTLEVAESEARTFSVAFVDDERMRQLNEMFRGKDATTDVLSFPFEAEPFEVLPAADGQPPTVFLGDIVISAEQAQRQAAENGLTLDAEIKQLILHGVLHLCGYDHETDVGEMNERELALREALDC